MGVAVQLITGPLDRMNVLHDMDRQADGTPVVHEETLHALAYPPGGVGRKTKAPLGIKLFQGMDQAQIALLYQIQEGNAPVQIAFGDIHHQAQIVLNHFLAGAKVTGPHRPGQRQLLIRRQQRFSTDFVEIELGDVVEYVHRRVGGAVLLFFQGQSRLKLRTVEVILWVFGELGRLGHR